METDKEVWEVAKTLVITHREAAPTVAREHATQHFQKGEHPSDVIWERIEAATQELVRQEEETERAAQSETERAFAAELKPGTVGRRLGNDEPAAAPALSDDRSPPRRCVRARPRRLSSPEPMDVVETERGS